jgi:hypothetical protein
MNRIPTQEEIAICAYLIWKHEKCPEGLDKVHWDQAEEQLIVCHAHDQWTSAHSQKINTQTFRQPQNF